MRKNSGLVHIGKYHANCRWLPFPLKYFLDIFSTKDIAKQRTFTLAGLQFARLLRSCPIPFHRELLNGFSITRKAQAAGLEEVGEDVLGEFLWEVG